MRQARQHLRQPRFDRVDDKIVPSGTIDNNIYRGQSWTIIRTLESNKSSLLFLSEQVDTVSRPPVSPHSLPAWRPPPPALPAYFRLPLHHRSAHQLPLRMLFLYTRPPGVQGAS